tara:strand:- start:511 stop:624 length:114 start_codon:yes stop_codon:yes gene_type:complete
MAGSVKRHKKLIARIANKLIAGPIIMAKGMIEKNIKK